MVLDDAVAKISEARFFLELLARLEEGNPITSREVSDEASYLLSALLNSCYSVLQTLKKAGKRTLRTLRTPEARVIEREFEREAKAVEGSWALLYSSRSPGDWKQLGLRHLSVHHTVVPVGPSDVSQTDPGIEVRRPEPSALPNGTFILNIRRSSRLCMVHPATFKSYDIVPYFSEHLQIVENLVQHWQERISALLAH